MEILAHINMQDFTRRVQHIKSGQCYRILGKAKVQLDGEWKDAVAYVHGDGRSEIKEDHSSIFIREESDFLGAFRGISYSEWSEITGYVQTGIYGPREFEDYSVPVATKELEID